MNLTIIEKALVKLLPNLTKLNKVAEAIDDVKVDDKGSVYLKMKKDVVFHVQGHGASLYEGCHIRRTKELIMDNPTLDIDYIVNKMYNVEAPKLVKACKIDHLQQLTMAGYTREVVEHRAREIGVKPISNSVNKGDIIKHLPKDNNANYLDIKFTDMIKIN